MHTHRLLKNTIRMNGRKKTNGSNCGKSQIAREKKIVQLSTKNKVKKRGVK